MKPIWWLIILYRNWFDDISAAVLPYRCMWRSWFAGSQWWVWSVIWSVGIPWWQIVATSCSTEIRPLESWCIISFWRLFVYDFWSVATWFGSRIPQRRWLLWLRQSCWVELQLLLGILSTWNIYAGTQSFYLAVLGDVISSASCRILPEVWRSHTHHSVVWFILMGTRAWKCISRFFFLLGHQASPRKFVMIL